MPYFPVDDNLHAHPKVDIAGLAAMGLWTLAGSWSKQATTGGFIPAERVRKLGGTKVLAGKLVTAGLWDVTPGGYQFHDWDHQAGNFDAETEKTRRDSERARARDRKREQRERDRGVTSPVTQPVTPPEPRTPPYPVPVPETKADHGTPPSLSNEIPARDELTTAAEALGIKDPSRLNKAYGPVIGELLPLPYLIDLTAKMLDLSAGHVRHVEAYIEKACRDTPDTVRAAWLNVVAGSPRGVLGGVA